MTKYIIRRFIFAVPVILGVATLVFFMLHLIPGDPIATIFAQQSMTEAQIQTIRERLGLNDPLLVQYVKYIGRALQGDLGRSIQGGRAVTELILDQFPYTLQLAFWGMLLATVLGLAACIAHDALLWVLGAVPETDRERIPLIQGQRYLQRNAKRPQAVDRSDRCRLRLTGRWGSGPTGSSHYE